MSADAILLGLTVDDLRLVTLLAAADKLGATAAAEALFTSAPGAQRRAVLKAARELGIDLDAAGSTEALRVALVGLAKSEMAQPALSAAESLAERRLIVRIIEHDDPDATRRAGDLVAALERAGCRVSAGADDDARAHALVIVGARTCFVHEPGLHLTDDMGAVALEVCRTVLATELRRGSR